MLKKLRQTLSRWLYVSDVTGLSTSHPAFWDGATHAILAAANEIHKTANGGRVGAPVNLQQARQSVQNLFDNTVAMRAEVARLSAENGKLGSAVAFLSTCNAKPPAQ